MNCLDSSAIIDYLEGEPAIGEFLRNRSSEPFFAPTPVLHEVFVGGARLDGVGGVRRLRADLDWIEPLPFTADCAAEAAILEAQLQDAGDPIGSIDTIIAGAVRAVGGSLITDDTHFQVVPDLTVESYRS